MVPAFMLQARRLAWLIPNNTRYWPPCQAGGARRQVGSGGRRCVAWVFPAGFAASSVSTHTLYIHDLKVDFLFFLCYTCPTAQLWTETAAFIPGQRPASGLTAVIAGGCRGQSFRWGRADPFGGSALVRWEERPHCAPWPRSPLGRAAATGGRLDRAFGGDPSLSRASRQPGAHCDPHRAEGGGEARQWD